MIEFWQSYHLAKQAMDNGIVHAAPHVFTTAFAMLISGHPHTIVGGLLILIGLSVMIVRGLWKMLAVSYF